MMPFFDKLACFFALCIDFTDYRYPLFRAFSSAQLGFREANMNSLGLESCLKGGGSLVRTSPFLHYSLNSGFALD